MSEGKSEALTPSGRGTTARRPKQGGGGMGEKLPRSGLVQLPICVMPGLYYVPPILHAAKDRLHIEAEGDRGRDILV